MYWATALDIGRYERSDFKYTSYTYYYYNVY